MGNISILRNALEAYDGKSPAILSEISAQHQNRASLMSDLVTLALDAEQDISEGATWVIKALLDQKKTLSEEDVSRLIKGLDGVTAWQAQLHICQCIAHISVPPKATPGLETWLRALLDAQRPFVRAWALDALCRLLGASSKTRFLLNQMESDKAASVRARVRNLRATFAPK